MKTLIVIDFQKDFANPNGTLYVPGAERAEDGICSYIMKHNKEISDVVFTVDWHTFDDLSFKVNGGKWPIHCVQYTEGASISNRLFSLCNYYNMDIKVFQKGNVPEHEEYGAFETVENLDFGIYVKNFGGNSGTTLDSKDIIICGLAGDYCVKESTKNLLKSNLGFNIKILNEGIASIDDGTTLDRFIKENNLEIETI